MDLRYATAKNTFKKMPKNVKDFIRELLGPEETRKLMLAIRGSRWIVITGPSPSGKTTIGMILERLGYPYVIDRDDIRFIHTSSPLKNLTSMNDIFESLGI